MVDNSPSSSPVSIRCAVREPTTPCEDSSGEEMNDTDMPTQIEFDTTNPCGSLFETIDLLSVCMPFSDASTITSSASDHGGSGVLPQNIPIMPQFPSASPPTHTDSTTTSTPPSFQRRGRFIVWPAEPRPEHHGLSAAAH